MLQKSHSSTTSCSVWKHLSMQDVALNPKRRHQKVFLIQTLHECTVDVHINLPSQKEIEGDSSRAEGDRRKVQQKWVSRWITSAPLLTSRQPSQIYGGLQRSLPRSLVNYQKLVTSIFVGLNAWARSYSGANFVCLHVLYAFPCR